MEGFSQSKTRFQKRFEDRENSKWLAKTFS